MRNSIVTVICAGGLMLLTQGALAQDEASSMPDTDAVSELATEWDLAQFGTEERDAKLEALRGVEAHAEDLLSNDPQNADYMVWEAIALSSQAGVIRGPAALPKVRHARELLENAESINPNALGDASVYTSLGSLYYQVPGFPISFGNKNKAEQNLTQALEMNPDGIDPNYFMADFLVHQHQYSDALPYIDRGEEAPLRPGRELADQGRREQLAELRATVNEHLTE